jgi:hypothetical protein
MSQKASTILQGKGEISEFIRPLLNMVFTCLKKKFKNKKKNTNCLEVNEILVE